MAIDKRVGFDSQKELGTLNINRLFVLQKLCIEELHHYLLNKYMYDYNDIDNKLQEITLINLTITKKLSKFNENKKI